MSSAVLSAPTHHEDADPQLIRIVRVPTPDWIRAPHSGYGYGNRLVTCEREQWGWVIPWMFRVLADPAGGLPMPAKPEPNDTLAQLGYYTALAHLLVYCLGWRDMSKGLRWWLHVGKPTPSVPLRLLAYIWDADGGLLEFLAWCDTLSAALRPESPLQPLNDPLLLAAHLRGPITPQASPPVAAGDLLILDGMPGWYPALERRRDSMPVDVLVRPVGWLGRFTRSPVTGLWYRVDHDTHLRGN